MNTEIYYPKSGRTVGTGTASDKSYTSPALGDGSIVYLSSSNTSNGHYVTVKVNNVDVWYYNVPSASSRNVLSSTNYIESSSGQLMKYDSGFPVDKYGNPYLMLGPGDVVRIIASGTYLGSVCITALEL